MVIKSNSTEFHFRRGELYESLTLIQHCPVWTRVTRPLRIARRSDGGRWSLHDDNRGSAGVSSEVAPGRPTAKPSQRRVAQAIGKSPVMRPGRARYSGDIQMKMVQGLFQFGGRRG